MGPPSRIGPTDNVKVLSKESQKGILGGVLLKVLHDGTQSHKVDIFVGGIVVLHRGGKKVDPKGMIVVRHDMVIVAGHLLSSKGFGFRFFDAFQDFIQLVVVLVIEFDPDILKLLGSGSTNFVNAVVEERIFFPNRFMIIRIIWMIRDFVIVEFVVMNHKEIRGSLHHLLSAENLLLTNVPDNQSLLPFPCFCRRHVARWYGSCAEKIISKKKN